MSPMIMMLAMLAMFATILWYGHTIVQRQYHKTMFAGFLASVAQWLFFLADGHTPIRALLYTAIIFIVMVFAWCAAEWKNTPTKRKTKDWKPSNAFWVYFLGGMFTCIGACHSLV